MSASKVKTLKGKAFHPRECGWLPLDKAHRKWEMPNGTQVVFQPHEQLVVYKEVD